MRLGRMHGKLDELAESPGYVEGGWDEYAVLLAERGELPLDKLVRVRRNVAAIAPEKVITVAPALSSPPLNPGEPWADLANAEAGAATLIAHLRTAQSSRPSATWLKRARSLLADVGPATVAAWLELAPVEGSSPVGWTWGNRPTPLFVWDQFNLIALKGLVWLVPLLPASPELARATAAIAARALRKVRGAGTQSPKVANAAIWALSEMDGPDGAGHLARLSVKVTGKSALQRISAALDRRATALGLTRAEIEEMAVPSFGLTEVGRLSEQLGDVTAELLIDPSPRLVWTNARGRVTKNAPVSVHRSHPDRPAELKNLAKDLTAMLSAQALRLDGLFLAAREWNHGHWREYYLDHPVMGTLARRLLWVVGDVLCGWDPGLGGVPGGLIALGGGEVPPGPVRLWHPLDRPDAEIALARAWLAERGIVQPFRQAHREIYRPSAGTEVDTFATHILWQSRFHELATSRGWWSRPLFMDGTVPRTTRDLPHWNLRAEFSVSAADDKVGGHNLVRWLITGAVSFHPMDATDREPLPLDQVPPLVFTEIMRDVELFVSRTTVLNDGDWQGVDATGQVAAYLHGHTSATLSATAESRREILTRLLPGLSIADRAEVGDRFLVVRGDRRTYKIHLGSGAVLMEPDDRYLSIAPVRPKEIEDVYAAFEGDGVLDLIVTLALVLGRDSEITDPLVIPQIAGWSPRRS